MKRTKILIISYSYYPHSTPRAFRWTALAEYWALQGYSVDVISCKRPGMAVSEVRNGVSIHRSSDPMRLIKNQATARGSNGGREPTSLRRKRLVSKLRRWLLFVGESVWKATRWPDYACFWIPFACASASRLTKNKTFDILITVSHPFSSHIVGYFLYLKNKKIPWICDIGDPFSFATDTPVNFGRLYSRLNLKAEKGILTSAKAVTVTNEQAARKYVSDLGIIKDKIKTIPPLLSLDYALIEKARTAITLKPTRCRIVKFVFLGALYRGIRNPEYLLKLLKEIANRQGRPTFQMHFWGGVGECREDFDGHSDAQGKWLFVHDSVVRPEIGAVMAEADVLVNISNVTNYQLPSKLIEYAAFGKPILNISFSSYDCSALFMKKYPLFLNIMADRNVTEDSVKKVLRFMSEPSKINEDDILTFIKPYLSQTIAEQYMGALSEI